MRALFNRAKPETDAEPETPSWAAELLEALQKQGRTQVKQAARLEATLAEHATRIAELGADLARQREREQEQSARALAHEYTPLFDALDALDEAQRSTADPHVRTGLALVSERVQQFCERAGFARIDALGRPADPRRFRVIGTEPLAHGPAGYVQRVVRAAIVHGEQLVREGEVIIGGLPVDEERRDEHVGN